MVVGLLRYTSTVQEAVGSTTPHSRGQGAVETLRYTAALQGAVGSGDPLRTLPQA